MEFLRQPNLDFIGVRKYMYVLSASLIAIGVISLIVHRGPKYSIDFLGGTAVQLRFEKPVQIGSLRQALATVGLGQAEIKHFGASNEVLVRMPGSGQNPSLVNDVVGAMSRVLADNPVEVRRVERVGPKIGGELRRAAVYAVLISLALLLIYISWRFEFKFAVGAVAALFHDVMITLGVFSLLGQEISLTVLAAFLTLVGYSLNDTIVVYDRIRENLKIFRRDTLESVINKSVNQVLSRTIITSGTTFLVVLTLFFLGGEVIRGFALALLVGIIVGTYSSVYVASPIVIELERWAEARKSAQRRPRPA
ncbi:MAG: protein translocase subunit SecF [candidate division KSB1 bacterium]|nr:protein translocase subunit SecF [candidate division KSB1 bacterium]